MKAISVCIPVYNTEEYLEDCLLSIKKQTFTNYEVIVVNDGSIGKDSNNKTCNQIVKSFTKYYKMKINLIEHDKNKGLLEARRSAIYASKGKYIFILDSDDTIPENALELLYNKALETNSDITIGFSNLITTDKCINEDEISLEKRKSLLDKKINRFLTTPLQDSQVFHGFLVENNQNGFLWGKLISSEVYKEALNMIPPMYCVFLEDFLQYFWISFFAKSYVVIKDYIHNYNITTGISSNQEINDINRWERICVSKNVFTSIYNSLYENNIKLSEDEEDALVTSSYKKLANNLIQLDRCVTKDLRKDAYNLLSSYWGEQTVSNVETQLIKQNLLKHKIGG